MATAIHPEAAKEEARTALILHAFTNAYGVKRFKVRYKNLQALLAQGGAGNDAVRRYLGAYFRADRGFLRDCSGRGFAFDHREMYGRGGNPLFFIGHPYQIGGDAMGTLDGLRQLGMSCRVLGPEHSWYGFGTVQIAVYHWPTVQRFCPGCPLFTEYGRS